MTHGGHKAGDQNSQDEALKPGLLLSGWGGDGPWGGARPGCKRAPVDSRLKTPGPGTLPVDSKLKTLVPGEASALEPGTLPGQAQKGPHLHGLASAMSPPTVTCVCSSLAPRLTSGHPLPLSPTCLTVALSGAGCWPCFTDRKVDAGELDPPEEE